MKNILFVSMLSIVLFSSCLNDLDNTEKLEEGVFKVEVNEVLEANQYTYFKGMVSGAEMWFAVGKTTVEVGKTYYYKDPLEMQSFKSKDLDRTFDFIVFLNSIQDTPNFVVNTTSPHKTTTTTAKESSIEIEHVEGAISIAELFENKEKYNGKIVTLQGKVVKFNPEIMNTNWLHIQDGTEFDSKFDLTVTCDAVVKVGDVITIEGVVALEKDFGAGYKYDLIVENGKLK